jgi:hypothetical protein
VKNFLLLMLSLFLLSITARGADSHGMEQRAAYYIQQTFQGMKSMRPACFYCDVADAAEASPQNSCRDYYQDLYSKPTVDFKMVLGYTDFYSKATGDIAIDGYFKEAYVRRITKPCKTIPNEDGPDIVEVGSCGFKPSSPGDEDHFFKMVEGPDGQMRRVNLTVMNASESSDEKSNLGPLAQRQRERSARTKQAFLSGLNSGDVVAYAGHARKGGGPDFEPPKRRKDGSVAYEQYRDRRNERDMLSAVANSSRPAKAVGVFACNADKDFGPDVRAAAKNKSAVATSTNLTELGGLFSQAVAFIDNHLAMRCEKEFSGALRSVTEVDGKRVLPPTELGFFQAPRTTALQTKLPEEPPPEEPDEEVGGDQEEAGAEPVAQQRAPDRAFNRPVISITPTSERKRPRVVDSPAAE